MFVTRFTVTLSDGTNTVTLSDAKVVWLEGGDNKVQVRAVVTVDQGEILDAWETKKTSLKVQITPTKCETISNYGDRVETHCTSEITDYASQSGTATLTWVYNPSGESTIELTFTTIE